MNQVVFEQVIKRKNNRWIQEKGTEEEGNKLVKARKWDQEKRPVILKL